MTWQQVSFAGTKYWELKSGDGNTTYNAPNGSMRMAIGQPRPMLTTQEELPHCLQAKHQAAGRCEIQNCGIAEGSNGENISELLTSLQIPETSIAPAAVGTIILPLITASNNLANSIQFSNADDDTAIQINEVKPEEV